jgi:death on curing protein
LLWIGFEDAVRAHDLVLHDEGSPGFLDPNYLESALYAPQQVYHYTDGGVDVYDLAAVYLFHIAKAHAFTDGNKRTALVCSLVFLDINGVHVNFTPGDLTLATAIEAAVAGTVAKDELAALLRDMPLETDLELIERRED